MLCDSGTRPGFEPAREDSDNGPRGFGAPRKMRSDHDPALQGHSVQRDDHAQFVEPSEAGRRGVGGASVLPPGQSAVQQSAEVLPVHDVRPRVHGSGGCHPPVSIAVHPGSKRVRKFDEQIRISVAR